jgi:hypothetical protein
MHFSHQNPTHHHSFSLEQQTKVSPYEKHRPPLLYRYMPTTETILTEYSGNAAKYNLASEALISQFIVYHQVTSSSGKFVF